MAVPRRHRGGWITTVADFIRLGASSVLRWWREHFGRQYSDREILTHAYGPRMRASDAVIRQLRNITDRSGIAGQIIRETGGIARGSIPRNESIRNAYQYHTRICTGEDYTQGCIEITINSRRNLTYDEIRQRAITRARRFLNRDKFGTLVFRSRVADLPASEIDVEILQVWRRT